MDQTKYQYIGELINQLISTSIINLINKLINGTHEEISIDKCTNETMNQTRINTGSLDELAVKHIESIM